MPFVARALFDELLQLQRDVREGRLVRYREPVVTAVAAPVVEIPAFIDRRAAKVEPSEADAMTLPPDVERAIVDNAQGDTAQSIRNRQFARALLAQNMDPALVAVMIDKGEEL